jgi:hypothetical protein
MQPHSSIMMANRPQDRQSPVPDFMHTILPPRTPPLALISRNAWAQVREKERNGDRALHRQRSQSPILTPREPTSCCPPPPSSLHPPHSSPPPSLPRGSKSNGLLHGKRSLSLHHRQPGASVSMSQAGVGNTQSPVSEKKPPSLSRQQSKAGVPLLEPASSPIGNFEVILFQHSLKSRQILNACLIRAPIWRRAPNMVALHLSSWSHQVTNSVSWNST